MKKIILITFVSLITFMIVSCKTTIQTDIDENQEEEEHTEQEYYLTYKADGIAISATDFTAVRNLTAKPRTLSFTGTAKTGANPKFTFFFEENFVGFSPGLNIHNYKGTSPSSYITYTNGVGTQFFSENDSDGIYVFISEISYTKGGTVKGTFNGSVKTNQGVATKITDGKFRLVLSN